MRIELSDGELVDVSDREAHLLYETLLERARQRGATAAARKLRSALTWSAAETRVAFDQFETEALRKARQASESDSGDDAHPSR